MIYERTLNAVSISHSLTEPPSPRTVWQNRVQLKRRYQCKITFWEPDKSQILERHSFLGVDFGVQLDVYMYPYYTILLRLRLSG